MSDEQRTMIERYTLKRGCYEESQCNVVPCLHGEFVLEQDYLSELKALEQAHKIFQTSGSKVRSVQDELIAKQRTVIDNLEGHIKAVIMGIQLTPELNSDKAWNGMKDDLKESLEQLQADKE